MLARVMWKLFGLASVFVFFWGTLLAITLLWLEHTFGFVTIEVIFYQLRMPMSGADRRYFINFALMVAIVLLLTFLFGLNIWRSFSRQTMWRLHSTVFRLVAGLFSALLLCGAVWGADHKYRVLDFLYPTEGYNTDIEEHYILPAVEIAAGARPNNLILVILESVEDTFNNGRYFSPPLMPFAKRLEKQAVVLRGHREVYGTNNSFQSMYAVLLGMPFLTMWLESDDDDSGSILSDKVGTGDFVAMREEAKAFLDISLPGILEKNGYSIAFFNSAVATFANFDALIRASTEHAESLDLSYFMRHDPDWHDHRNRWGVNDSYLFARLQDYLAGRTDSRPFMVSIQLANSHIPGHVEKEYPQPYGDFRDAFVQTDIMVADFVDWVRAQPFAENTTIVIYGDHLMAYPQLGPLNLPPRDSRSIMAMILNSRKGEAGLVINKLYATWDLAPTILEAMGFSLPGDGFALGTSLFSSRPTLLQHYGVRGYERKFKLRSQFYIDKYIW